MKWFKVLASVASLVVVIGMSEAQAQGPPPGQLMYAWVIGPTLFVSFLDGVVPGTPHGYAPFGTGCGEGKVNCVKVTRGGVQVGETLGDGNVPPCPKMPCPPVSGQVTGPYNMGFCRYGDPSCPVGHLWSYIIGYLKPGGTGPIVVTYDGVVVATIGR